MAADYTITTTTISISTVEPTPVVATTLRLLNLSSSTLPQVDPSVIRLTSYNQIPPVVQTPTDPYFSSTSLLLHMNGANNSTTFTDNSPNLLSVTAGGTAKISTAQSKFDGASGVFDQSAYLTVVNTTALSLPSDFTIEAWLYQPSTGNQTYPILLERGAATSSSNYGIIVDNSTNPYTVSFFYGDPRAYVSIGSFNFNAWNNVAVTRSGGTIRTFNNGTLVTSATVNNNFTSSDALIIGSAGNSTSNRFNGYIDELRITKGQARYTVSYTLATAAFPDQGATLVAGSNMNPEWRRPFRII